MGSRIDLKILSDFPRVDLPFFQEKIATSIEEDFQLKVWFRGLGSWAAIQTWRSGNAGAADTWKTRIRHL
jgi:hypothetical protein